jgi:hypothetical protein
MSTEHLTPPRTSALEWLLIVDDTLAAAADEFGISAETSDEELEGIAWNAGRTAYDEDYSFGEGEMLSALKAVRQAVS